MIDNKSFFEIFFILVLLAIIIILIICIYLLGYYHGGKDFLKNLSKEIQDLEEKEDDEEK